MKQKFIVLGSLLMLMSGTSVYAGLNEGGEIVGTFDSAKVILPSTQYTPDEPYEASVWVFNEGRRYEDQYYNHIWATPALDSDGHKWYENDYTLTDSEGIGWTTATSPFSSDEYYNNHKSFRWAEPDITAEIYMRRIFSLDALPEGIIYLACGHDDAPAEWYINGEMVHSVGDGWNVEEYVALSDEQRNLLKTDGTPNVLAVHVHQNWGGAYADCGLYGADMSITRKLLTTVADGPWECKYYMLNYNSDIEVAETAGWASENEDESDWMHGYGPMSNEANMFYVTEWPSQVRPILVRRHFNISAYDMECLKEGSLSLTCSYDENPKIYLNGTLIWQTEGWSDNNYATHLLSEDQIALLHEGDNTLSVSLAQGGGGGHIDYGLEITAPYIPTGISVTEGESAETFTDKRVFDLNGRYLGDSTDTLPKGIYIVGGKKIRK